jgi:hypothetical protein
VSEWLGHENGCISQYTSLCDCLDPNNPVVLADAEDGETNEEGTNGPKPVQPAVD